QRITNHQAPIDWLRACIRVYVLLIHWSWVLGCWSLLLLQQLSHFLFLLGTGIGFFSIDQVSLVERCQRVVHELHSLFFAGLNNSGKHVGPRFPDNVSHRRRISERLKGEHSARLILSRNKLLANDA